MIISVVIPAFNEEDELPWCLAAIKVAAKCCAYPVEIIVVDNASTDRTREVAEANGAWLVIVEPRKGISFARQAGFQAANGDIICCIDADTRMPCYWFSFLLAHLTRDVLAVSGPSYFYDLNPYQRMLAFGFNINAYVVYRLTGAMLQGGNFAIRRDALVRAGEFNTSLEFYGEDVDLARRVARLGKICWAWNMSMPTSGRRILADGLIKTGVIYALNYAFIVLFGRPLNKTHKDIRNVVRS